MKTLTFTSKKAYYLLLLIPFLAASCVVEVERGYDGRPGNAYLALDWEYESPTYLDAGTSDIPAIFEYGRYYLTRPGYYSLYYEGETWDGYFMSYYAWEIDYEIWRNEGTAGGPGYNGYNGRDTYLTIVLSPYGPYTDRWEKSTRTDMKIIESSDDKIIVEKNTDEYGIRITYKRVEKRK